MKREGVMSASIFNLEQVEKSIEKHGYVYVQPKLEGDRMRAVVYKNKCDCFSSGGVIMQSVPHIVDELKKCKESICLDGEIWNTSMRHSEIRSITSRTKNIHKNYKEIKYYVFDIINYSRDQRRRLIELSGFFERNTFEHIKLVPNYVADSAGSIEKYYNNFLKLGYEGIIVRLPDGKYVPKKVRTVFKLKRTVSDFFKIIKVNEQYDKNKVAKGTWGSFTMLNDEGKTFRVGTGLNDSQKQIVWDNKKLYMGRLCKVRFAGYTKVRNVPKHLSIDKEWAKENIK